MLMGVSLKGLLRMGSGMGMAGLPNLMGKEVFKELISLGRRMD